MYLFGYGGTGDGHHSRRTSLTGSRKSSTDDVSKVVDDDETVVEDQDKNILSAVLGQLRRGADLSRITLPTFILEPRSMLERITNFMQHPETLLPTNTIEDPEERFISVVKFYLSGWHIKPPGVKKPLNPVLGEFYSCYWDFDDDSKAYYFAEQTSHHPPKSSYFYMAPKQRIRIDGTLKPRGQFLGNSAASMMEGIAILRFLDRPGLNGGCEKYYLTQPNMYVRGILVGKMKFELGDHSYVRCPTLDLVADIEFKVKGYIWGEHNSIGGTIKRASTGEVLYELSGKWNEAMYIKNVRTGEKRLLFDATRAKPTPPSVRPIAEQEERESVRLWKPVVDALIARDHDTATAEKSKIENQQRLETKMREADGVEWRPRFFRETQPRDEDEELDFVLASHVDDRASPEEQVKQILAIGPILPGRNRRPSRYDIPQYRSSVDIHNRSDVAVHDDHLPNSPPPPPLPRKDTHLAPSTGKDLPVTPINEDDLIDLDHGMGKATLVPTSEGVKLAGESSATVDDIEKDLKAIKIEEQTGIKSAGDPTRRAA
ncbi:hypothetical protein BJ508DRAFT_307019 [Ascobolus immersus RN42]|uniref:Oxysterol-binding protein n=1 Tax=Ascobolus immersus RN42 TaxID=1160509 RepID=A0A3N4I9K0_ASCIM|nr:hypothetical protein BJ508DRAFT_307019 [Ascobolus immersus RN42]